MTITSGDVLHYADTKLNDLFEVCRTELHRRVKATKCDDLSIIRGNEVAKRALTIAVAGNHSILFVGPPCSGKSMLRAAAIGLAGPAQMVPFEARPCPCGQYQSSFGQCHCTHAKIRKHRATIPAADIVVEVVPPRPRDLEGRPGTSSSEVLDALADLPDHTSLELGEECRNMLRAACVELNIDARARERIIVVARTIANMDRSESIRPSHICEAINYQTFRR